MKHFVFLLAILVSFMAGAANVNGRLIDEASKEGVVNGAFYFCQNDEPVSNLVCLTDIDGFFDVEIPEGIYNVVLVYQTCRIAVKDSLTVNNDLDLGTIGVDLAVLQIDAAVAVSRKPVVKYGNGKILYDLSAMPAVSGGNALDGLLNIPGITLDGQSSIRMNGFISPQIRVNGRNLRLTDEETMDYIANLSISSISQVEYIKNPGPQYESDGRPVLDIVLKQKEDIFEGSLTASAAYRKLFSEGASVKLDLSKGKTSSYLYYRFRQNRNETVSTLDNEFSEISRVSPSNLHNAQIGTDIRISASETFGYRFFGSFQNSDLFSDDDHYTSRYDQKAGGVYVYNTFSAGRFRWDTDVTYSMDRGERNSSRDDQLSAGERKDTYSQKTDASSLRLSTEGRYSLTDASSFRLGGYLVIPEIDSDMSGSYSNKTGYSEKQFSPYASFDYMKNGLGIAATLSYLNVNEKLLVNDMEYTLPERHIGRVLPSVSINYDLNPNNRISLDYKMTLKRSSYRDIIPVRYASSGFLNRQGNPDLKSSVNSEIALSYMFMKAAYAELSYSMTSNPMVELIYPENGRYMMKMQNLESSDYLRLVLSIPVPIVNKPALGIQWIAFTNLAWHRQWDKGVIPPPADLEYNKVFNAYYIQHKHTLALPHNWSADCQVVYYSPLYSGFYKTKRQWWIDLNVRKRIRSCSLALGVNDFFNTNIADVTLGPFLDDTYRIDWQGPRITLSATFHFGKSLSKKVVDRKVKNSDNRLNNSVEDNITIGL